MNSQSFRPALDPSNYEFGVLLIKRQRSGIVIVALLVALSTETSVAIAPYHITDLGTLGGTMSHAFSVNIHGDVVGSSTIDAGTEHAFLYHNGTMIDLGVLSGDTSS